MERVTRKDSGKLSENEYQTDDKQEGREEEQDYKISKLLGERAYKRTCQK